MRLPENEKAVTGNEQQRLGNCFGDASERVCDWERGARGRAVSFWGDETFLNRCDDDIRLSDHPPSLLVTTNLLSASMSLFLFCLSFKKIFHI